MREIDKQEDFKDWLIAEIRDIVAVQGIDLTPYENAIMKLSFSDCIFLGCKRRARLGTARSGAAPKPQTVNLKPWLGV